MSSMAFSAHSGGGEGDTPTAEISVEVKQQVFDNFAQGIYENLNDTALDYEVFVYGLKGYWLLKGRDKLQNDRYLTVVDFRKSANDERLFVIDLEAHRIVMKTYCAHGMNTGGEYAKHFSNIENSSQSSLGFYVTDVSYKGRNGYSLRLNGQERNYNSNARSRSVVMHGADYASEEFIKKNGRLGRSQGCTAIPPKLNREVIDLIKGKSCLFIYAPDRSYTRHSRFIRTTRHLDVIYQSLMKSC
jgi:hypothetical protein